mmetsp:Transcript_1362/g.3778  ORF Transcript_1362/g.3778 Transcript_1362/m.3778 type:complete len:304 (-) Transcript_1362:1138-2049(-)
MNPLGGRAPASQGRTPRLRGRQPAGCGPAPDPWRAVRPRRRGGTWHHPRRRRAGLMGLLSPHMRWWRGVALSPPLGRRRVAVWRRSSVSLRRWRMAGLRMLSPLTVPGRGRRSLRPHLGTGLWAGLRRRGIVFPARLFRRARKLVLWSRCSAIASVPPASVLTTLHRSALRGRPTWRLPSVSRVTRRRTMTGRRALPPVRVRRGLSSVWPRVRQWVWPSLRAWRPAPVHLRRRPTMLGRVLHVRISLRWRSVRTCRLRVPMGRVAVLPHWSARRRRWTCSLSALWIAAAGVRRFHGRHRCFLP